MIGFAAIRFIEKQNQFHLMRVNVDPLYRKKGIGRRLYQLEIEWWKQIIILIKLVYVLHSINRISNLKNSVLL